MAVVQRERPTEIHGKLEEVPVKPEPIQKWFLVFSHKYSIQHNKIIKIEFHQFPTKQRFPTEYFRMKEFETLKEVFSRMFDIKERSV